MNPELRAKAENVIQQINSSRPKSWANTITQVHLAASLRGCIQSRQFKSISG